MFSISQAAGAAEDDKPPVARDSDASDDDELMEVDGDVPAAAAAAASVSLGVEVKRSATPRPAQVSSGLPQSKEELESLISLIHETVNNSVLPRLHKCLNAKVTIPVHSLNDEQCMHAVKPLRVLGYFE